ncbi:SPOR domain-containing protein [Nonlabens ulvanivorans]|uniref:Sporulation related protein n=1 Tax=Nonlabens ulvanivorans TaxID=906888 RepID=A0A084JUU0_NONUL|nr:SPOR domain-containing protein [Nonlabens ulvanivorans]KEZ92724.1 translation initiation factor IF-2 [Nonlabens ulvanivorans]PRX15569.1 sporulation related protein [Nonlabens ulvanivorans]WOI22084.1 SPOR domain-containing protein [Nonlabens ulvanivorans]
MHKHLNSRIVVTVAILMLSSIALAQHSNQVEETKIESLISKKISMDKEGKFKDRYTIQLFYGEIEGAKKIEAKYKASPMTWESNLEYEAPNFKLWVGSYRNKLEAERALIEIKKEFPNAFILKP